MYNERIGGRAVKRDRSALWGLRNGASPIRDINAVPRANCCSSAESIHTWPSDKIALFAKLHYVAVSRFNNLAVDVDCMICGSLGTSQIVGTVTNSAQSLWAILKLTNMGKLCCRLL